MTWKDDDRFWDRFFTEYDRLVERIKSLEEKHSSLSTQMHIMALKVSLIISAVIWGIKEMVMSFISRH